MTPWMNIIMTHPNLPESHSPSRNTRPYLTSVKFFTRNNPSLIQQNAYITSSVKRQLWPSVVHLTYAIYWFMPSLKVPNVIHSAIFLVLSVAIRDTAVSLAPTSMTVEPPTCSAPQVRHGRSNNTSLANQTISLIWLNVKDIKNNTLEKPNVAFANDSLNTGKLQIILITPALQQQYLRISTCLRTPSRTCYLSLWNFK